MEGTGDTDFRERSLVGLGETEGDRGAGYFGFQGVRGIIIEIDEDLIEMRFWPFNTDFTRLGSGSGGLPPLIGDLGDVGDVLSANWERPPGNRQQDQYGRIFSGSPAPHRV